MAIFNSYVSLTEGKYIIGNMHSNRFVTYQPADQLFRLAKYTHSNVPAPASSKPQNVDHYWVQSVQNWANLWIYVDFQNPLITGLTGSPRLCKENSLHPGISLPRLADSFHQLHLAWISISLAGGIVPGLPLFLVDISAVWAMMLRGRWYDRMYVHIAWLYITYDIL